MEVICSCCHCEDQKFLHHVWDGNKVHKMCTSCVLFEHKESFCPTCFGILVSPCKKGRICCSECGSYTHVRCTSGIDRPFKCSTCRNADRLIFDLKELELKDDKGSCKVMDVKAARLLLTAARIVKELTSKAHDGAVTSAVKQATGIILDKKKAVGAVERFMKFEECNEGPSLLD